MTWQKIKNNQGSASIEATVSLTIFIFVIVAIYAIVNFCIIQQKVSYAIDSAAKQISDYGYFYYVTGLKDRDEALQESAKQSEEAFNALNANISSISDSVSQGSDALEGGDFDKLLEAVDKGTASAEDLSQMVQERVNDPGKFLTEILAYFGAKGLDSAKTNLIADPLARVFVMQQFGNDYAEANKALVNLGVVDGLGGMKFGDSKIFSDSSDDVIIRVKYKINLKKFGPFDIEMNMEHVAKTKAWLGGDVDKEEGGGS